MSETCGRLWGPPIAVIIDVDSTYIIPNMLPDSGTPTATLVTDPITFPALSGDLEVFPNRFGDFYFRSEIMILKFEIFEILEI